MRKLPNFNSHNCYCEQKIAYNFLFTAHINTTKLETIISMIDNHYKDTLKKYDVGAIKNCITKNYNDYMQKPFIACNYSEIAEKLPL